MKMPLIKVKGTDFDKMKRLLDLVYTINFKILDFAEDFLKTYTDDYEIFVSPSGDEAIVRVMDALGNEVCVRVIERKDYIILKIIGRPQTSKIISKEELRKEILDVYGEHVIDYYG